MQLEKAHADQAHELSAPDPNILFSINLPGINLALWQRLFQTSIAAEVAHLRATDLSDNRHTTTLNHFDRDIEELLTTQGLAAQHFTHLMADMSQLARLFCAVSGAAQIRLRLVTTDQDDCKRFHIDRMNMRLLCTYQGPGTEWLTEQQVDRVAERAGVSNQEMIRFGAPRQFETQWVGIMRGDPKNEGRGLIHRSPPVAHSGIVRLLFCLDC